MTPGFGKIQEGNGYPLQCSWASLVAQLVKNPPAMRETWLGEIPWRREWLPTPAFWPGECHGLYSPWGHKSWTRLSDFHFHHFIYYCGQESLRRNGVALKVNKRVQNAVLGCDLKKDRMNSVPFQGRPFNITVIQVYALTSNAEEAEVELCCEDLQDLLELIPLLPKNKMSFSL